MEVTRQDLRNFTFKVLDVVMNPVDVVSECPEVLLDDLEGGVHPPGRAEEGDQAQGEQGEPGHPRLRERRCDENNRSYLETNTAISGCQSQIGSTDMNTLPARTVRFKSAKVSLVFKVHPLQTF